MQFQPVRVEERLRRVADRPQISLHGRHIPRVIVAERGRHLAGTEIEIFLALGVDDPDPAGGGDHRLCLETGHVCRL